MDSKKKLRRPVPSSSSSSSDDSSFSSSSDDARKKQKRRAAAYSSSSSEEEKVRKSHKHKKSSVRKHSHSAKLREKMTHGKKARSMSPASKAAHKHKLKLKKAKYAAQEIEHDRRSRSPTRRNVKKDRTPEHKIASPTTRIRVSIQNNRAIQDRPSTRIRKESPMSIRRREQAAAEKERIELSRLEAQKESERMKRAQQEEEQRYKRLKKHHHEQSPSPARAKISIHDRLDGGYNNPRRSISRDVAERDDYMMRDNYDRNPEPERSNYEYREREDERDRRYEYSSSSSRPQYEEQQQPPPPQRHHRHHYNEPEPRESDPPPRAGRNVYESRRRFPDDNPPYESSSSRDFDKWPKDETPPMRSSWKDSGPSSLHSRGGPPPKRFPYSSHSSSGPSGSSPHGGFKPRFSGSSPHFQKRFPFTPRYPNQYSKINYSKRNLPPSATETLSSSSSMLHSNEPKHEVDSPQQSQPVQLQAPLAQQPVAVVDQIEVKSEIIEHEEVKVEADTTTMSGNVDTQSQEEGEGNLSEFSDVDDEILNREEELINAIKKEQAEQEDQADEKEQKIISKIHANNELKREMDLDFEEISDGEFEEESRLKTIGDALGVDWESLAKETQKPLNRVAENSTTKSRLTPHRILWEIGVSAKILGEEKARQILTDARDKLRAEKVEADAALKVKAEPIKTEASVNGEVKLEPKEEIDEEENETVEKPEEVAEEAAVTAKIEEEPKPAEIEHDFELDDDVLPHPLASIQVLTRQLKMQRRSLILNSSCRFGRALSARKDIRIRRELCRLPARDIKIDRSCAPNEELRKNMQEIYQRVLDSVAA